MPEARHDRTNVTEADRDEVITCLKRAYVDDELTTDQLSERVGIAHLAATLEELDAAVADVSIS
jgi:truncated hemoglobin YjbI